MIIYDLTPKNSQVLQKRTVAFLIDRRDYQSYRALSILADMVKLGRLPEKGYMYTEINIKAKYNLN